jgi:hypothetical protein
MADTRYTSRNPWFAFPPILVSIAADGPAAEVFRTSPEEPWRVLRTQWRVAGMVPGPIEGGGRASGYFTSATGATIYRGDAWPAEYVGDAFIADCGSNLIHRKQLLPTASPSSAQRPADERGTEFATCSDVWFRPVQFANAPDGTLYVIDMYREIIEHPWSLPPGIKEHLDLNSGNDRGRIYRIVPDGFKPASRPAPGQRLDRSTWSKPSPIPMPGTAKPPPASSTPARTARRATRPRTASSAIPDPPSAVARPLCPRRPQRPHRRSRQPRNLRPRRARPRTCHSFVRTLAP